VDGRWSLWTRSASTGGRHRGHRCIENGSVSALSAERIKAWLSADLSQLDLLAIQIDSMHISIELTLLPGARALSLPARVLPLQARERRAEIRVRPSLSSFGGQKRLCCVSSVVSLFDDPACFATPQGWRAAPPPSAASALTRRDLCRLGL
jgi:hypothetical protein